MAGIAPALLTAIALHLITFVIVLFPSLTQADPLSFEVIYMTDTTTEMSGSIIMQCRDAITADTLEIDQAKFWLNRYSACDLDLRSREDVRVTRNDDYGIKFNLTHNLDGVYTCGRLVARNGGITVDESSPLTLISLQTIVPVPSSLQTTYTARVGDTAILPCPTPPGALLQFYSVIWMKDDITIIEAENPQTIMPLDGDPRYDLDNAYSLVIHSVNVSDSSSNYKCVLSFTIPTTGAKWEVQPHPDREIPLMLNIDEETTISTQKPVSIVVRSPTEQPSFTCIANAPNIAWTYTNSEGEEMNLTTDGAEYQIVNNVSQQDGRFTSTITFLELNLPPNDSAVVRCKVTDASGTTTTEPDGFFVITADYSRELTTSYHQKDYSLLFIGLITASICVLLIAVISIGLLIVVCCHHHRKVSNKYTMSSSNCVCI